MLDYELTEQGLVVFSLGLPQIGERKFILDTGATTSALYQQRLPSDTSIGSDGEIVRIHGITASEMRPTLTLSEIKIGASTIRNVNVAILEQPQHKELLLRQVSGVIGLDVLASYRLLIDPMRRKLVFIDNRTLPILFDTSWVSVSLTEMPFGQDVYGLHFLELRVNGAQTYAMLDTGAEFNVMNWNFKNLWQLSIRKRSLRKEWEHNGSIGEFKPRGTANLEEIKSKDYSWIRQTFLVFDLNAFNSVGLQDRPLMIAGMPFLKDKTVLLDFEKDLMWIQSLDKLQPSLTPK